MSTDVVAGPSMGKGRKKLVIFLAGGVIVAILAGVGAWKAGLLVRLSGHASHAADVKPTIPSLLEIPDIVTNLDVGNQRARFIKLHVRLVLPSLTDRDAAATRLPEITDAIQTYLRAVTPEDLAGGEGTYRLRGALLNHLAVVIAPTPITDVLFSQLLVQ